MVTFMKILSLIPAGDSCGWGVAGSNLARTMPLFCDIVTDPKDCDVVLVPMSNHDFGYATGHEIIGEARRLGKHIVGYGFQEFSIHARKNAHLIPQNFSALACGSSWMMDCLKLALHDSGFDDFPLGVVLQGVDSSRFYYRPQDKPDFLKDRYVVGAMCKFEYRKGPDVIIESFRRFKKIVTEAIIVHCFDNPWFQQTAMTMVEAKWEHDLDLMAIEGNVYVSNINRDLIAAEDQVAWRIGPNESVPNFWRNTDLALHLSRIEAGQSNTAVESTGCGIGSILVDDHGMSDLCDIVREHRSCGILENSEKTYYPKVNPVAEAWEPCVEKTVSEMYRLYKRQTTEDEKIALSKSVHGLTWENTAKSLVDLCNSTV